MVDQTHAELTGADFGLVNAGYTQMPDPAREKERQSIDSDSASLREAADQLSDQQPKVVVRQYTNGEGKPADPNEAVTLTRAARDYASATAGDRTIAENQSSEALAARIDALRAEVAASDPDAPEFYGFEPPQRSNEPNEDIDAPVNAAEDQGERPAALDPDFEQLLRHPQVRLGSVLNKV
jgi:hypothetical protein